MRATTLYQPYASLISIGAKPFETRGYPPPPHLIGKRIAIHAAAKPVRLIWRTLPQLVKRAIANALNARGHIAVTMDDLAALPHGAVVCTAILADAYQCGDMDDLYRVPILRRATAMRLPGTDTFQGDHFGDYSEGRWAWHLTDVHPLAVPVGAKGKQGWWEWEGPANG